MTAKELFLAVGEVPEEQIAEAETMRKRKPAWLRYGAAAACLAVLLAAALYREPMSTGRRDAGGEPDGTEYTLDGRPVSSPENHSVGAEIGQLAGPGDLETPGAVSSCADVEWLSPEEIFAMDTEIFRGTVRETQYYVVDLGVGGFYYTRALVEVTDPIRSQMPSGSVCSLLFMGARGYMSTSLDGPLASLEEGSDAIFMPIRTGPDTGRRDGERYFCYADLAELYLSEGMRFVFLDTGEGLDFSRSTYEDLEAEDLDQAAAYIRDMLARSASKEAGDGEEEPE